MDDHSPEDYSQKRRCHAIMKDMKDKDKRPVFVGGKLRTTDGYIKPKTISDFNKTNGIKDERKTELNVDRLTMHLELDPSTRKKNKDKDTPQDEGAVGGETEPIEIEEEEVVEEEAEEVLSEEEQGEDKEEEIANSDDERGNPLFE